MGAYKTAVEMLKGTFKSAFPGDQIVKTAGKEIDDLNVFKNTRRWSRKFTGVWNASQTSIIDYDSLSRLNLSEVRCPQMVQRAALRCNNPAFFKFPNTQRTYPSWISDPY